MARRGLNMVKVPEDANFFLCPTGPAGLNDHTLERHTLDGCPLWGFLEGIAKNFRKVIKPGDVFLFTTAGAENAKSFGCSVFP